MSDLAREVVNYIVSRMELLEESVRLSVVHLAERFLPQIRRTDDTATASSLPEETMCTSGTPTSTHFIVGEKR